MSVIGSGRARQVRPPAKVGNEPTLYCHPDARSIVEPLTEFLEVVESMRQPSNVVDFHLWATTSHIALCRGRERGIWVTLSEIERRAAQGVELVRACGATGGPRQILDPMAGWGVDALVLAGSGCQVSLVERHPALWALQWDLIRRSGIEVSSTRCADGLAALDGARTWDVVYLDPMFPPRSKKALPGKRMQWLAALARPDSRPEAVWVERALSVARERVVLKRRRRDPVVLAPDWQIAGRTVRYDVYRGTARERV